jgi:short subunit dehydrogenase-like uncharacterized protein
MITLFGATGYTGRLVARALARQELPFRLAGRSPEKLARLATSLPGSPAWQVADAARPATLSTLVEDTHVLINCAGPFTDLGEPVVALAACSGVHYLDTSNELGYVHRLRSYDALARSGGAAIVPACGFEVALVDCAAAVLNRPVGAGPAAGRLDEIAVVYDIRGTGTSLGTRRSAIRALATSWLGYRDSQWVQEIPCRETRRVQLADGSHHALSFPSSEIATVPSHLPVQTVTTWMVISPGARFWAPALLPLFAWLAQGPVGRLVAAFVSRVFPPPEMGMRSQAPFTIRIEARRAETTRTLTLSGIGVYDLTAEIVAYAAAQMAQPGYDRVGVLAPATAFDPQALLDRAGTEWGVTVQIPGVS